MERKSIILEVKDLDKSKRTAIIAHAAYDNIDFTQDISRKGMFNKSWSESKDNINLYLNHNDEQSPGKVVDVYEDSQFAFTKDTNSTWYYDGAAWVASGASGDVTGVTAGTGITVTNPTGPVPTVTNDMATTITAAGDIVVGTGSGTYDNLPIGTTAQVLTADTTVSPYKVKWATPAGGSTFSGCFAYSSTDQTIANGTNTFLSWNSESFDVDGYHSTSSNTSRFTIPTGKTGYFLWSMNINWGSSATGIRTVEFFKNGTKIVSGTGLDSIADSDGFVFQSPSVLIQLSAGDYVETRVSQSSGGNLDVRNSSFVSIVYLGA